MARVGFKGWLIIWARIKQEEVRFHARGAISSGDTVVVPETAHRNPKTPHPHQCFT